MRKFFCLTVTVAFLLLLLPCLRADDSPFALPVGEPLATLALPEGQDIKAVSLAISKALVEQEWENLGWEGNVTTATSRQSRVIIKVFALASAADVKFYVAYTIEGKVSDEKCRQIALRQLRTLEKTVAEQLNLFFRKAKGNETVDRAMAS